MNALWIINHLSKRKHGTSKFSFTFIYKNVYYGVWVDYVNGKIFVSNDYNKNCPIVFATTLADHKPNTLFLSSAKNYSCWKTFIKNYRLGNVRFENMKIKSACQNLLKLLLTH